MNLPADDKRTYSNKFQLESSLVMFCGWLVGEKKITGREFERGQRDWLQDPVLQVQGSSHKGNQLNPTIAASNSI